MCQGYPCKGANMCQREPRLPNLMWHRMYPIVYVWFPSQGAIMCQVSHLKVPSCAKDAHRMVYRCAKLPKSSSHCMPILPIARCHCVPMLPIRLCHHVLREVIAWFTRVPSYRPLCAKVAKSRCQRVPSCPSQGSIGCKVAHHNVPLRAKLPIARCHCVPS